MQPEYTTAVSRQSEHTRLWRWVIYKDCVEFRAGLSNTQKAAQSDADACLKNFQTPAVELTQRKPVVINLIRQATLSARQRTGDKSIGTRVKQGKFQIVSVTYGPKGGSKVDELSGWMAGPELIPALDALTITSPKS